MAGRYQTYPEYCNSGVEWIGTMPGGWCVSRIKFFSQLNPSKQEVRGLPLETEVTFLPMEAIGEKGELDTSAYKSVGELINGYTYVGENDVLIAKITPCFENGKGAIACGLKNGVAFATTEVIPLRVTTPNNSKFLYYLLYCDPFRKIAEGTMYGAGGQKRVSDGFVANYHFAKPSNTECETIANFLDHETAKIDTLIDKQQQLIKLLKEKRQAVISHAVTKGLNPDAPMKDSGVEWLGEVPEHWGVQRIGTLFLESSARAEGETELEYPILRVSIHHGISDKELDEEEMDRKISRSEDRSLYKVVGENDLAYNMMRAWQGGFGAAKVNGLISPAYVVCKPKSVLNSSYFELVLRTSTAVTELKRFSRGITDFRLRLYWDEFKNIQVPVPPKRELDEILRHIETVNTRYDRIAERATKQIELLNERRTALISAAVTGKIDVRNWQPAQPKIPMEASA
jgi:type I restriction enzyme S subunit